MVWDLSAFAFLENIESPDSVHPSLWRQARLNRIHGLFKVCDRMYQVRGFDIANITIIEGDTGLILIDPLTVCEAAAAALALYRQHRGDDKPVRCVIYSHSHTDHYGGVEGVITPAQAASGEVQVIAPDGFMEAAIAENILAGVPMRRRGMFQFGPTLAPGPRSHVDSGLGKAMGRGTSQPDRAEPADHAGGGTPHHRRHRHRLPAHARDRGAGGDELPLPAVQGAEPGRERLPHDAQPVPDPRCARRATRWPGRSTWTRR